MQCRKSGIIVGKRQIIIAPECSIYLLSEPAAAGNSQLKLFPVPRTAENICIFWKKSVQTLKSVVFINNETKKYKFKIRFVGSNDYISRTRRQEEAFKYADKGVVLPNRIASSLGLNKFELEDELAEAKASDLQIN